VKKISDTVIECRMLYIRRNESVKCNNIFKYVNTFLQRRKTRERDGISWLSKKRQQKRILLVYILYILYILYIVKLWAFLKACC